jgi:1-deoxy-D-xylulose-5-phosphate reductoisomerase
VVLGATGSIGRQTLEVARHLGRPVAGLAVRSPSDAIVELARSHPAAEVAIAGATRDEAAAMAHRIGRTVRTGSEAVVDLARTAGTVVVNGIVGAAGLRAGVAALEAGNRLGLANKESMVAAGPLVLAARERGGAEIIPIDSEHSALFQLLGGTAPEEVGRLVLTASGGPFRGRARDELEAVTPEQALLHPTWDMGRRITVDSATLANKGLEVIEAHHLFGVPFDRIEVVVHPQSTVHSMVELVDGSLLAHLGHTDMRIPIQYALTHPHRRPAPTGRFPLPGTTLTFEEPDREAFPALDLAYRAGEAGGSAPAVYNAADEVAVDAFLSGRLGFLGIAEVIERTLDGFDHRVPAMIDEVLDVDREARAMATSLIGGACS